MADGATIVGFKFEAESAREGGGTARIHLVLEEGEKPPRTGPISLGIRFFDRTATSGVDYVGTPRRVEIPVGVTEATIEVPLLDDCVVEGTDPRLNFETFGASLEDPGEGVTLGRSVLLFAIEDDETPTGFSATAYTVYAPAAEALIQVLRDPKCTPTAAFEFATLDGTARAGLDYTPVAGRFEFVPGQSNLVIRVPVLPREPEAGPRTVLLQIRGVSPGGHVGATNALLTIESTPPGGVVEFEQAEYRVNELNGYITIGLKRSQRVTEVGSVQVRVKGGTASGREDFDQTSVGSSLPFWTGTDRQTFQFRVIDDGVPEPAETVELEIEGGANTVAGTRRRAVVTIVNGTAAVGVRPVASDTTQVVMATVESVGQVSVQVNRFGDRDQPAAIGYAMVSETARAGEDYLSHSGRLEFAAGKRSAAISIALKDDFRVDGVRTFRVALTDPTAGVTLLPGDARVVVHDDEVPGGLDVDFRIPSLGGGAVHTLLPTGSGKFWISGTFQSVGGHASAGLVRLHANGNVDTTFQAMPLPKEAGGKGLQALGRILPLRSGQILAQEAPPFGEWPYRIIRFNADGTLDSSFQVPAERLEELGAWSGSDSWIELPDRSVVTVNTFGGVVVLEPNGGMRANLHAGLNRVDGAVAGVLALDDGAFAIWGTTGTVYRAGVAMAFGGLARFAPDGTLDASFRYEGQTAVLGVANAGAGRLLIARARNERPWEGVELVRLGSDGLPDSTFSRVEMKDFRRLIADGRGRMYVFGSPRELSGSEATAWDWYRLGPDGGIDPGFVSGLRLYLRMPDWEIQDVSSVVDAEGRIVATGRPGSWNQLSPLIDLGSTAALRLDPALAARSGFVLENRSLAGSEASTDGVAVEVRRVGNLDRAQQVHVATADGLAREGVDYRAATGTLDFAPGDTTKSLRVRPIDDLLEEPDKPLAVQLTAVAGSGAEVLGSGTGEVMILDDDRPGALDASFRLPAWLVVDGMSLRPDGRILVAGQVPRAEGGTDRGATVLDRTGRYGGVFERHDWWQLGGLVSLADGGVMAFATRHSRFYEEPYQPAYVRLLADGSRDPLWTWREPVASLSQAFPQADGRVFGVIYDESGLGQDDLIRITEDGATDRKFKANLAQFARSHVLAVLAQPDGSVLVAGAFYETPSGGEAPIGVLRLLADGRLDPGFRPIRVRYETVQAALMSGSTGLSGGYVGAVAAYPGGRLILAGAFEWINDRQANGVALCDATGLTVFEFDVGKGIGIPGSAWGWGLDREPPRFALAVDPDGSILLGGTFDSFNGLAVPQRLVRIRGDAPPLVTGTTLTADGRLRIEVRARVGRRYVLESSPDLAAWMPVVTNQANGVALSFDGLATRELSRGFFRIRQE